MMVSKYFFNIILFSAISFNSISQCKADTEENNLVIKYNELASLDRYIEAINMAKKALSLTRKNDLEFKSQTFHDIGYFYQNIKKYKESEEYYKKSLKLRLPESIGYARTLHNLAGIYYINDKDIEAEKLLVKSFYLKKKNKNTTKSDLVLSLSALGTVFIYKKEYDKAESYLLEAIDLVKGEKSPTDIDFKFIIRDLENIYTLQKRKGDVKKLKKLESIWYQEFSKNNGERLKNRSPIYEKILHRVYYDLARSYQDIEMYKEAIENYEKSIRIIKKRDKELLSPEFFDLYTKIGISYQKMGAYNNAEKYLLLSKEATTNKSEELISLQNLALLYSNKGNFKEAKKIIDNLMVEDNKNNLEILSSIASVYFSLGLYNESKKILNRIIDICEKKNKKDKIYISALTSLSTLYFTLGQYKKSLNVIKKSLNISGDILATDSILSLDILNNLSGIYTIHNDFDSAKNILNNILEIQENKYGNNHLSIAKTLNNLSYVYSSLGKPNEAIQFLERALKIRESHLGNNHPDVALILLSLSKIYWGIDPDKSTKALLRSIEIKKYNFGDDSPKIVDDYIEIAKRLIKIQPDYSITIAEKALEIQNKISSDVTRAFTHKIIAKAYIEKKYYKSAYSNLSSAIEIYNKYFLSKNVYLTRNLQHELTNKRETVLLYIDVIYELLDKYKNDKTISLISKKLLSNAFKVSQLSRSLVESENINKLSSRFSEYNTKLTNLIRELQDLVEIKNKLRSKLDENIKLKSNERRRFFEDSIDKDIKKYSKKINDIKDEISKKYPSVNNYNYKPSQLNEIQNVLKDNEAMVYYVLSFNYLYIWAVENKKYKFKRVSINSKKLEENIIQIISSLDITKTNGAILKFDVNLSNNIYNILIKPIEKFISKKDHLIIVPDRFLHSIPFNLLAIEDKKIINNSFSEYKDVQWLIKNYSTSNLPTVSSLITLREKTKSSNAKFDFLGIGDPILSTSQRDNISIRGKYNILTQALIDTEKVKLLPSLPETSKELTLISKLFQKDKAKLLLQENATEENIKSYSLNNYKIIAFATHGLISGDLIGLNEPALVLTPPKSENKSKDDGILTASEINNLNINADLVILSACNTGLSYDSNEYQQLSYLSKSFFYAGARSMIVSKWPVASDVSVEIISEMLGEAYRNKVSYSKGLRQSLLKVINNSNNTHYAHPIFWAPFVYIGAN